MKLYQYAVLYTPIQTKDQADRGEKPKTVIVVDIKSVVANSDAEVGMLAARELPPEYADKLDQIQVAIRPF